MPLTMKAPPGRWKGERTVRCNEAQADILRKVGWTEVLATETITPIMAAHEPPAWFEEKGGSPQEQTLEPDPVEDPDEVRPEADSPYLQQTDYKLSELKKPKRTYHRRVVDVEPDGSVKYKIKPPKRRYRRRDLTAEE